VVTPPSPGFSECSDEHNYDGEFKKSIREQRANTRALSLLDHTAGSDVRVRALSEPHVEQKQSSTEVRQRLKHFHSKKQANLRANELLNETVGGDVKARATVVVPSEQAVEASIEEDEAASGVQESVKDIKGSRDKFMERGANMRALALLHETVGGDVSAAAHMASNPVPERKSSAAIRREAIERYAEKQRAMKAEKAALKPKPDGARFLPQPVAPVLNDQEKLAESSRKPIQAEGEYRDPETIAGMKCDIEIAREERAKKRALQMMKYGKAIA